MRKLIFCSLFIIFAFQVKAQVTQITEDFNTSCASATGFPMDWVSFNPVTSTTPDGAWQCAPLEGRSGTPGILCDGVWSSTYHLDTSYLISPALNLSGYSGNIYVRFDTKTTRIHLGARLFLLASTDTAFDSTVAPVFDLTQSLTPVFSNADSSDWVTHYADLTTYKADIPLYLAFRYVSSTTEGSIWYLDNVFTTTFPANVPGITKSTLPLSVIGKSTGSDITLSYTIDAPGVYHLAVYDMTGRVVHQQELVASAGSATHTISGLQLSSGLYLIKMGNGAVYGTAKTIVQ